MHPTQACFRIAVQAREQCLLPTAEARTAAQRTHVHTARVERSAGGRYEARGGAHAGDATQ